MELKNFTEDVVLEHLDGVLDKYPDCCRCENCRRDIAILALNNLPPQYTSSEMGTIYRRINGMSNENAISVVEEIAKAVEIVRKKPRHEERQEG